MSKKFKFCFKDGKLVDYNEHKQENSPKVEEVLFENNKCKVLTNTGAIYKDANDFFSSLPADLFSLDLPTEKYEKFMKIITNVAEQTTKLCSNLIGENEKCAENLKTGTEFVLNKLKAVDTPRKLEKEIQSVLCTTARCFHRAQVVRAKSEQRNKYSGPQNDPSEFPVYINHKNSQCCL